MKNPQETDAFVPSGGQRSLQIDNASISSEATHDAGKARTDGNPPEPNGTH